MAETWRESPRTAGPRSCRALVEEVSDVVARREHVLDALAVTLRRFAQIEAESASMIRHAAAIINDRPGAERRRQFASEAELRALQAADRARRILREHRSGETARNDEHLPPIPLTSG